MTSVDFSQSQPKTSCIFRTFRVKESFLTKKQNLTLSKVDIKKWRRFFIFVCLNGCHFLNHKISRNLTVRNLNFCPWTTQLCVTMTKFIQLERGDYFLGFLYFGRTVYTDMIITYQEIPTLQVHPSKRLVTTRQHHWGFDYVLV